MRGGGDKYRARDRDIEVEPDAGTQNTSYPCPTPKNTKSINPTNTHKVPLLTSL